MIERGSIWWLDLAEPRGSEPGFRRPGIVVQENEFTKSRIQTVLVAILTANLNLANAPGNVLLRAELTGLGRDSVVNVSQIMTLDRSYFLSRIGMVDRTAMYDIDDGLRLILGL